MCARRPAARARTGWTLVEEINGRRLDVPFQRLALAADSIWASVGLCRPGLAKVPRMRSLRLWCRLQGCDAITLARGIAGSRHGIRVGETYAARNRSARSDGCLSPARPRGAVRWQGGCHGSRGLAAERMALWGLGGPPRLRETPARWGATAAGCMCSARARGPSASAQGGIWRIAFPMSGDGTCSGAGTFGRGRRC
jgi:hypothetical protein